MYSEKFIENDHIRLRDTLASIKGKFILSYNDDNFIRKLYSECNIIEAERNNNIANCNTNSNKVFKELIIKNY